MARARISDTLRSAAWRICRTCSDVASTATAAGSVRVGLEPVGDAAQVLIDCRGVVASAT